MQTDNYLRDLSTLRIEDAGDAGGTGANLGEPVAAYTSAAERWPVAGSSAAVVVG